MVDYYAILGIVWGATPEEVRRAHRKLALLWHPDRNKSHQAAARFSDITEAYKCLSNAEARAAYDLIRPRAQGNGPRRDPGTHGSAQPDRCRHGDKSGESASSANPNQVKKPVRGDNANATAFKGAVGLLKYGLFPLVLVGGLTAYLVGNKHQDYSRNDLEHTLLDPNASLPPRVAAAKELTDNSDFHAVYRVFLLLPQAVQIAALEGLEKVPASDAGWRDNIQQPLLSSDAEVQLKAIAILYHHMHELTSAEESALAESLKKTAASSDLVAGRAKELLALLASRPSDERQRMDDAEEARREALMEPGQRELARSEATLKELVKEQSR
jgi:hypothetical protein